MHIHADFSQYVIIKPEDYHWVKSPRGEVSRVMFDRIGTEQARATSLVKYAPHSAFPPHQHMLGEEILVLSGTFTENNHQDYPQGWYLRNPHNSIHQTSSEHGALIFVKLRQMTEYENQYTRINTHNPDHWRKIGDSMRCTLYQSEFENTYLEKLTHNQVFENNSHQGLELFILSGYLRYGTDIYTSGTWLRFPTQQTVRFQTEESETIIYVKEGHLIHAQQIWGNQK